ncbi:hypothetical protein CKM354_001001100 [Cercospora kikuchii]|uniref:Uncharacterized protein n=1 Tax=Cercospora kikuchii TaxID=84275 RepID=A0A9P3FKP4_9PEZI|nr:uncharacterized protein CKM354_001001100 [Cercospora kikuchii]GIZ46905.1 hypothetical protein CKM354_001001100 [Cercospora kikuchii]
MPADAKIQAATLDKFIQGWKEWTPEGMMGAMGEGYTQRTLPFSLGHPPRSKPEVEFILPKLIDTVKNYKLDIKHIVHDAAQGKAVIYAVSAGDTPFGDWTNEYAVFLKFSENSETVQSVEEMVDSAFMKDFMPKLQKHLVDQGLMSP